VKSTGPSKPRTESKRLITPLSILVLCLGLIAPPGRSEAVFPAAEGKWQGGNFPDTSFEGMRYVSTAFLESLFGKEGSWVPDRQKFVIADAAGRKWTFTLDNPYMNVGDEVFNLGFPLRRGPQLLYLPLPSLLRILGKHGFAVAAPGPLAETRLEAAGLQGGTHGNAGPQPGGYNIFDLGAEDRDNGTLVSLRTAGKLDWESFWVPPHFILKFAGGLLSPKFPPKTQGLGLVKNILAMQEKDQAQITLTIHKPIDTVEVAYSEESPGYLVTVRRQTDKKAKAEKAEKAREENEKSGKPGAQGSAGGTGPVGGTGPAGGTIIIDPGHGGKDQGAQVSGVNEAQITLAVGLALKEALAKLGYKALLTRDKDEFVSLEERPKFASSQGGDLFVSLHCNSMAGSPKRKKAVSGFTAYILREGESEEDKALARRENQAVSDESGHANKSEISPVEWILLEHQLNLYSKESESFASRLIDEFSGFPIEKYGTGASQAGFYVLVGAYMPAVLFEMGFLTNEKDRRLLASEKGQKQVAEKLAKAIDMHRKSQKAN
jgi:N-acetylmuramoyl-L-alanine amidase